MILGQGDIMKKRGYLSVILSVILSAAVCSACSSSVPAVKKQPVTVTIWHVYGGQTDSPLNNQIDEFNKTVGKDKGINVQVTCVSNTNTIHEMVLAAANHDPGAGDLPDMFVSYPKTVLAMPDDKVLINYRDYFSDQELSAFIPSFVEEGIVNDRLVVLPVAKSTEIMFVNQTAFDRYAAATGAKIEDLGTWEGLFKMACEYTKWSDDRTPNVKDDGKPFFVHDYHFNYFQVGVESLGEKFFNGNSLAFGPAFARVWEPYARAGILGGLWLKGGYATDPLRTGECITSVASSASVLYYSDIVTYPDNTSEKIRITAYPCPVFKDGAKMVMQRGAGVCTVKSTPEKEKASVTFLKWLTAPERNVSFVTSAGYMPVTQEGFDKYLPAAIDKLTDEKYKELYRAFQKTQASYTFYTAPQLSTYLALETAFESSVRQELSTARNEYLSGTTAGKVSEEKLKQMISDHLKKFSSDSNK
jgi:multiple sugar transport system substrate-binding protein